uniref:Secreted protein n=1 Tax=Triticum urartu TaxID=4572 RepID=A0A8R7PDW2_TRIUA
MDLLTLFALFCFGLLGYSKDNVASFPFQPFVGVITLGNSGAPSRSTSSLIRVSKVSPWSTINSKFLCLVVVEIINKTSASQTISFSPSATDFPGWHQ